MIGEEKDRTARDRTGWGRRAKTLPALPHRGCKGVGLEGPARMSEHNTSPGCERMEAACTLGLSRTQR